MRAAGTRFSSLPFRKITPLPRPQAKPMSASLASPGPLTVQPMTATVSGTRSAWTAFSTRAATGIRSTSQRPHVGQETKLAPRLRRPSAWRICQATKTSFSGGAVRETRTVSASPSARRRARPAEDFTLPAKRRPASVIPAWKG